MAEDRFPTIRDLHAVAAELIERGFGELPFQILVVPDSTMQALARHSGAHDDAKPALMIEYEAAGGRLPVSFISTERLDSTGPRQTVQ